MLHAKPPAASANATPKPIRPLIAWLIEVLFETSSNEEYLQLGFYALVYHQRTDLNEFENRLSERIFRNICDYYKKFILIPKITNHTSVPHPALNETMIDLLADLIIHHAIQRSAETPTINYFDMTRYNLNLFFFHQLDVVKLATAGTAIDPITWLKTHYANNKLYFSDILVDYLYYFTKPADAKYVDALPINKYLELANSGANDALRYAWANFAVPQCTLDKIDVAIAKFLASDELKFFININRRIKEGFLRYYLNATYHTNTQKDLFCRVNELEIASACLPPSCEAQLQIIANQEAALSRPDTPEPAKQVDLQTLYTSLQKIRVLKSNLRVVKTFQEKFYFNNHTGKIDEDKWIAEHPLYLFLFKYNTDAPQVMPNNHLEGNYSLVEKMAALLFVPQSMLSFIRIAYDNVFLGLQQAERPEDKERLRNLSLLIDNFKTAKLPRILHTMLAQHPELFHDNKFQINAFIDSLAVDDLFTEDQQCLFSNELEQFHLQGAESSLFWKLLTAEIAAYVLVATCSDNSVQKTLKKLYDDMNRVPGIIRTENLYKIITDIVTHQKFILIWSKKLFASSPPAIANNSENIVQEQAWQTVLTNKEKYATASYRIPGNFQNFITATGWNVLCSAIKERFAQQAKEYRVHFEQRLTHLYQDPQEVTAIWQSCEALNLHRHSWSTAPVLPTALLPIASEQSYLPPAAQPSQRPALTKTLVAHTITFHHELYATVTVNLQDNDQCDKAKVYSRIYRMASPQIIHYFYVPFAEHAVYSTAENAYDLLIRKLASRDGDTRAHDNSIELKRDAENISYLVRIKGHAHGKGDVRFEFSKATIVSTTLQQNFQLFVLSAVIPHYHNRSGKTKKRV